MFAERYHAAFLFNLLRSDQRKPPCCNQRNRVAHLSSQVGKRVKVITLPFVSAFYAAFTLSIVVVLNTTFFPSFRCKDTTNIWDTRWRSSKIRKYEKRLRIAAFFHIFLFVRILPFHDAGERVQNHGRHSRQATLA